MSGPLGSLRRHYNKNYFIILILFFITVCFFYAQNQDFALWKKSNAQKSEVILNKNKEVPLELLFQNLKGEKNYAFGKNQKEDKAKKEFTEDLYEIVGNFPIKEMIPYIIEYDRNSAGLIVGIAKKESNWGKRAPRKNGQTCYNYWGYKGGGSRGYSLGYGCFGSPKEAVDVVGGRIKDLAEKNIDTPQEMLVWKCGKTCAGHNPNRVKKWVSDVSAYYNYVARSM